LDCNWRLDDQAGAFHSCHKENTVGQEYLVQWDVVRLFFCAAFDGYVERGRENEGGLGGDYGVGDDCGGGGGVDGA